MAVFNSTERRDYARQRVLSGKNRNRLPTLASITTELVDVLNVLCTDEHLADLMNLTLSCEDDERLTDRQVDVAGTLFSALTDKRPDLIPLAQSR